uniref:Uncharacterized protein n=1 Tax=Romanomermis culicivorax TaxID=13658 RepID=A0A915I6F5_ROMCU
MISQLSKVVHARKKNFQAQLHMNRTRSLQSRREREINNKQEPPMQLKIEEEQVSTYDEADICWQ